MPFAGSALKFTRIVSYCVSPLTSFLRVIHADLFSLLYMNQSVYSSAHPREGYNDATRLLLQNVLQRTCVHVCLGVCARDCLKQSPGRGIPHSRICTSSLHFKAVVIMFPPAGTVSVHSLDGSHFKFCLFDCHATVSPHFSLHFSAH